MQPTFFFWASFSDLKPFFNCAPQTCALVSKNNRWFCRNLRKTHFSLASRRTLFPLFLRRRVPFCHMSQYCVIFPGLAFKDDFCLSYTSISKFYTLRKEKTESWNHIVSRGPRRTMPLFPLFLRRLAENKRKRPIASVTNFNYILSVLMDGNVC